MAKNAPPIYSKVKEIESRYLSTHDFARFAQYALPEDLVRNATNVLSFGVLKDIRFEQALLEMNPNLNIHLFDPTPKTINWFNDEEVDIPHRDDMVFHPVAYYREKGTMKFYQDKTRSTCFTLVPIEGENVKVIDVPCNNIGGFMEEIGMSYVDIIKADIEGVWYEIVMDILENNIPFGALALECEMFGDEEEILAKYENMLQQLKDAGYKLYLNRDRKKGLTEIIVLPPESIYG